MPVILRCHPDLNNLERDKTTERRNHPLTTSAFDTAASLSFLTKASSSLYQSRQVPIKPSVSKVLGQSET